MKTRNVINALLATFVLLCLLLSSCSRTPVYKKYATKDNRKQTWEMKNSRINHFIAHYSKTRHIELSLKIGAPYLPEIRRIFREHQLPEELAYLPLVESAFKNDADSGRAVGMWQFTEATAEDYGLTVNWFRDERKDWRKATRAAATYLSVLGKKFNYNWELALAAYNGGPGYIDRKMKAQGTWNYWDLKIKTETYNYVPKFLAMLHIAKQKYPELYHPGRRYASL